ncbi:MAG TPA: 2-oxoacid:acceptor oxidoreductase family protein [Symbiobacteriaceae bacterium]|jgi:2-oxoglutarate ferredoxin oxidoreductase subunit gamma|nr:2-oxoacid:acceptor oxidoreductase family protein [Symbiobacteriaceae bacterium]
MHEVLIAGFGGQGVLTAGQLLAYAGNFEGKQVSWVPAYGPEQRGGTANCSVVISDRPVACTLVTEPTACIVMNQPSLEKFEKDVQPGGVLVVNTSLCEKRATRTDITVINVAASDIAAELGSTKFANMVALGALLAAQPMVDLEMVLKAMIKVMGEDKARFVPVNRQALQKGMEAARVAAHL